MPTTIKEVAGASGNHRNRLPLNWRARLEHKAAVMTGQASGPVYETKLASLLQTYRQVLTIPEE